MARDLIIVAVDPGPHIGIAEITIRYDEAPVCSSLTYKVENLWGESFESLIGGLMQSVLPQFEDGRIIVERYRDRVNPGNLGDELMAVKVIGILEYYVGNKIIWQEPSIQSTIPKGLLTDFIRTHAVRRTLSEHEKSAYRHLIRYLLNQRFPFMLDLAKNYLSEMGE